MDIVGYADRLSAAPGDVVRFMVSTIAPRYEASIVRLIHGDTQQPGPGYKDEPTPSAVDGQYVGREQAIHIGSHVVVADTPALRLTGSLALHAWVYPTTPGAGAQGIITKWSAADDRGYGLMLDATGALALWLGDGPGRAVHLSTGVPLRAGTWYSVAASLDAASGEVLLVQAPQPAWPDDASAAQVHHVTEARPSPTAAPLIIAGCAVDADGTLVGAHFNGKIDAPRVFGRALSPAETAALASPDVLPADLAAGALAAWDFSRGISSTEVLAASPHGLHGHTVNMPMRAVTGHNWSGREVDYRAAAHEYAAIHFHDDDQDDLGWQPDFAFEVPADLRSGVYAAHLRTPDAEDYIPFIVRPRRGTATAPIAVLLPTLSYLAYANEHITWNNPASPVSFDVQSYLQPQDHYAAEHHLLSLYDHHSDGSGTCYASRLRPLVTMRPKYHLALVRGAHQFNADLHLIDWLETKGFAYDAITDEDLHAEGRALLAPYRVLLTGSHPEYWTAQMLNALETYRDSGGRVMYLGGNGFYWVTSIDPSAPHRIELRRGHRGTGTWRSAPGETHHSSTGEPGGLWRDRGRPPQRLVGVGMTTQGFDTALPYYRQEGSLDPRAAFIVEGIAPDEPIGAAGLVMNGAAGLELDRADVALGTPPHALVIASATGFSDSYQHVVEEVTASDSRQGGPVEPRVRADVVYFEAPQGGAVFSVGSITWCGCLSQDNYNNNVSRMTENVLRRFLLPP